jgi:uncharacterized protein
VSERLAPTISPESEPFWEATRERRLALQWCTTCDEPVQFPRSFCPSCQHSSLEWRDASGSATVYAVTVNHRPEAMGEEQPYVVALVDLDEGARFMTNIVGCAPEDVRIGMAVRVSWEVLEDGRNLPLFAPVGSPVAHAKEA